MSDITKKIYSIDPDDEIEAASTTKRSDTIPLEVAENPQKAITEKDPVLRQSSDDPVSPKTIAAPPPKPKENEPVLPRFIARDDEPVKTRSGKGLIIAGGLMAVLTMIAIGAWLFGYFELGSQSASLTPLGVAALLLAVFVPAISIFILFYAFRALNMVRNEAAQLAHVANRLTRADERVTQDVARMSTAIRSELASVDMRLAESRAGLEGLATELGEKSSDMSRTTVEMAKRSETIGQALTVQREAVESLSSTLDKQLETLMAQVNEHRSALSQTGEATSEDIVRTVAKLKDATDALTAAGTALSEQSDTAKDKIKRSGETLLTITETVSERAASLDRTFEERKTHIETLSQRLAEDDKMAKTALTRQADQLAAIDAQIEITEGRLTALIDHAQSIQSDLTSRIEDMDESLGKLGVRGRNFTSDTAERVTHVITEARRDISRMETELGALQSRLDSARDAELDLEETRSAASREGRRLKIKPLDDDFPPVEPPEDRDDDTLDLVEALERPDPFVPPSKDEPVLRPGQHPDGEARQNKKAEKQAQSGWRWRDMLGGIDPLDHDDTSKNPSPPTQPSKIERPPAGVPLTAPVAPPPNLPDGSDIVSRLRAVQLAPSAIVDEGTILDATAARRPGSSATMESVVLMRLRDPVVHLRGVLTADRDFRMKAETYVRDFATQIGSENREEVLRDSLGSASGRAFLLCSAALYA